MAFPVLGAGIALQFPENIVARVFLEEIHKFEQNRSNSTPIVIRIVIHPDDEKTEQVSKCNGSSTLFTVCMGKKYQVFNFIYRK